MTTKKSQTEVNLVKIEKVVYNKKSFLGIFNWYVRAYSEKLQDDICIETNLDIEDVYLNGIKLKK